MHMVIKVLVYATSENDALGEARRVLNNLCGDYKEFDFYNTFDDGWATRRWGELPKAIRVCGDFGLEKCDTCAERFQCYTNQMNSMLEESMLATKQEFLKNLGEIKKCITIYNDDQLFEDDDFKWRCHQAGQYKGSCVYLYDQDGEGIRDNEHLKNVLSKWACNHGGKPDPELEDKSVFIVPADVHY